MIPDELEQKVLRKHYVEKWTVGTIARQLGLHHSTVARVLRDHGATKPVAKRPSIVDPYLPFLREQLERYPTLPASRLYQMVVERGYPGKPDHFRSIVARIRPKRSAEAFLRVRTLPGEEAQVDWAHFGHVQIGRARRRLSAFVMVLSLSRLPFVRFFYDQRMGSFLAGHVEAWEFFEGVTRRVLYDNLKSVVLERHGDAIRFHPTAVAAHTGCGRSSHVWRGVPWLRNRGYAPTSTPRTHSPGVGGALSLRAPARCGGPWQREGPRRAYNPLSAYVLLACPRVVGPRGSERPGASVVPRCGGDPCHPDDDTQTVREAWEDERTRLLDLPADPFPALERVEAKVGKQPYVRFDRNDYSVPHDRTRRVLTVWAGPDLVRVAEGEDVVAEHRRSFDKGQQIEDPAHIEALVAAKREGRAGRGMDRLRHAVPSSATLLEGAARRGHNLGSAVAGLLRLLDTWGAEAVEAALVEAIRADALHVAAVRQVLEQRHQDAGKPPPVAVPLPDDPRVRDQHVRTHDLATYDALRKTK